MISADVPVADNDVPVADNDVPVADNDVPVLDDFDGLTKLSLCPTAWLLWVFDRLWLISAVPVFLILVVSVLFNVWNPLGDWVFFTFAFLLVMEWRLFRGLLESFPRDLLSLAESGRLKRRNNSQYKGFSTELHSIVHLGFDVINRGENRRKIRIEWWVLASFLSILVLWTAIFAFASVVKWTDAIEAGLSGLGSAQPHAAVQELVSGSVNGLIPLFWSIPVGAGIWVVVAVGLSLNRLIDMFEFDIVPGHPDGSGGLQKLGDICFRMGTLALVPQLVTFVLFLYGRTIDPDSPMVTMSGIVSVLFLLLGVPCFVRPVLSIHQEMERQRDLYETSLARRTVQAEEALRGYLTNPAATASELDTIYKTIETLNKLDPSERKFPVWPFSRRIAFVIGPNIILPLVTIITTFTKLPPAITDFIKTLFGVE